MNKLSDFLYKYDLLKDEISDISKAIDILQLEFGVLYAIDILVEKKLEIQNNIEILKNISW